MHSPVSTVVAIASIACAACAQQIAQDPGRGGVPIELVHLYHDEYPQGGFTISDESYLRLTIDLS